MIIKIDNFSGKMVKLGKFFFCVQREDIKQVRAAAEIDPLYAETLAQVQKNGVEVLIYGVYFSGDTFPTEINLINKLSFNSR